MRSLFFLPLVFSIGALAGKSSRTFVIYGEDDRKEIFDASSFEQNISDSVAVMVPDNKIFPSPIHPGFYFLSQLTLRTQLEVASSKSVKSHLFSEKVLALAKEGKTFCPGERFVDQPAPGRCSGFLIAPDLMVTAGHCSKGADFCSNETKWVFGFKVDQVDQTAGLKVSPSDVYTCKRIISRNFTQNKDFDYTLFQLDRRVEDRAPLRVRSTEKLKNETSLMVIGSPMGLPLKVAGGAKVRDNSDNNYFVTNLDTFEGNSGSPVMDATTGVVEGILVRGEVDFINDLKNNCLKANRCEENRCNGEEVSRMVSIPEVGSHAALGNAINVGNLGKIKTILGENLWIDFYLADGKSPLIKAVEANQLEVMKLLIERGSEVNLQDTLGNSALHYAVMIDLKKNSKLMVEYLIRSGANSELTNKKELTPFFLASSLENITAMEMLISLGTNKNALNKEGETVLFGLARVGNLKLIKKLIHIGVDPSVRNLEGKTYEDFLR